MSRPSRTRGLKHILSLLLACSLTVASFTDAWIETPGSCQARGGTRVASFTDAWIETGLPCLRKWLPPVASFTDAWIETSPSRSLTTASSSRPSRTRGLKRVVKAFFAAVKGRVLHGRVD